MPSGIHSAQATAAGVSIFPIAAPSAVFQVRRVLSAEPVRMAAPSGEKRMDATASAWPLSSPAGLPLTVESSLTMLPAAMASVAPSLLRAAMVTLGPSSRLPLVSGRLRFQMRMER